MTSATDRPASLSGWQRYSWLLVVGILLTTVVGAVWERQREVEQARMRDEERAARAAEVLKAVGGTLVAVETASALVEPDGSIDSDRFRHFAQTILQDTGMLSVAIERWIGHEDREALESQLGGPVVDITPSGGRQAVGLRDQYLVIVDVWPAPYRSIVGRDLLSESVRREAAEHARDRGRATVSAPVTIAPDGQPGVLLMAPLYRPGLPLDTVEDRRRAVSGLITVAHVADVFLAHVRRQMPAGSQIRLEDGGRLIAQTDPPPGPDAPSVEADFGGRRWTVAIEQPDSPSFAGAWTILLAGLGVAAVVGLSFHQSMRHSRRVAAAHDELAALVANLQRNLLAASIDLGLEGVSAVVRYLPAAPHARLGGDWYDVFPRHDGQIVVAVGDVTGHGVDAVVQMQEIRQVTIAYAYSGHGPGEVIRLTDRVLRTVHSGGLMTTVWLGVIDPAAGTLSYASAGHPPALLSCDGSDPVELEPAEGIPLNTGLDHHGWGEKNVHLPSHCVIALYTDGVVESRGLELDVGIAGVKEAMVDPTRPLDQMADEILDARPDPGQDDAALVLVRVGSAPGAPATVEADMAESTGSHG